jgi:hypothetical protein
MTSHKLGRATSFFERLRPLSGLAWSLFFGGVAIDALASYADRAHWLQSPGAAITGGGIAMLISQLTGQAALKEAYNKDSNLRRKDDLYLPLHTDVKAVLDRLIDARGGAKPFPQAVAVTADGGQGLGISTGADGGSLARWVDFRADSRIDNFSPRACILLNRAVDAAEAYNAAMSFVHERTREVLCSVLTDEIARTRRLRDFELWEQDPAYMTVPPNGPKEHWFALFKGPRPPEEIGEEMALWWTAGMPHQPDLTGWLVGGRAEIAADRLHAARSRAVDVALPLEWHGRVLEATSSRLEADETYLTARQSESELFEAIARSEEYLAAGLRVIRDRYEGGEPLV